MERGFCSGLFWEKVLGRGVEKWPGRSDDFVWRRVCFVTVRG